MNNLVRSITEIAALIVGGAATFLLVEAAAATPAPDAMAFARGAQTWANNCSRCHNMRDPKELRDDQWRPVVTHMRIRAGMTGEEARDVLTFLQGSN